MDYDTGNEPIFVDNQPPVVDATADAHVPPVIDSSADVDVIAEVPLSEDMYVSGEVTITTDTSSSHIVIYSYE